MGETSRLRLVRLSAARRSSLDGMTKTPVRLLAALAMALTLAGCGSSTTSGGPQRENPNTPSADVARMVECFRAHGMPNWPDPNYDPRDGRWHLDGPPLKDETRQACTAVIPHATPPSPVPSAQFHDLLQYARCLRSHGVPGWPDPTNVTAHDIVTGSLGYLDPVTIVDGARQGILTWLPEPGTVIGIDQRLYEVDGRPVVLWQGNRPAWRDLVPGMPAGPDVTQAERNLDSGLSSVAIRRWQARHGLPQTGVIALGQVVFQPGPVRVATVPAALGTPVGPGAPILTATSTRRAVSVQLDPNRQTVVHPGDRVTITLPNRHATNGTVVSVGAPVANPNGSLAIPVSVGLTDPDAAQGLDAGAVQVSIVTAEHDNVLAVPVDALLAAPGGGYQVAVTTGGRRRLVTVHCGLFDDTGGVVEVAGDLGPGTTVEVPVS
jgi:hypothetical protein